MKTVTFLGTTQDEAEEKEKHWKSADQYYSINLSYLTVIAGRTQG